MIFMVFQTNSTDIPEVKPAEGPKQQNQNSTSSTASAGAKIINATKPQVSAHKLILYAAIALILFMSAYLYLSLSPQPQQIPITSTIPNTVSTQNSSTTTAKPTLNINTLTNRSNALFSVPNQKAFTLFYTFMPSPPPHHNNYTTVGNTYFNSSAYGLNFTSIITNYSSPISPFDYNLSIPSQYASKNSPLVIVIYLWKSNTVENSTTRYLSLLYSSIGESYNYTHHLNIPNYGNHKGSIDYGIVNPYYLSNGTAVNATGLYSNSLSDYISNFAIPYANSLNANAAPAFLVEITPVYGTLVQSQLTFEYNNYVVSVYSFGVTGKYNESYGKLIASHLLKLLETNTYS